MDLKNAIKNIFKLLIPIYVGAALGYLITLVTSAKRGSYFDAFSPVILFNAIVNDDSTVIYVITLGTMFFMWFNFFRKSKMDWNEQEESESDKF